MYANLHKVLPAHLSHLKRPLFGGPIVVLLIGAIVACVYTAHGQSRVSMTVPTKKVQHAVKVTSTNPVAAPAPRSTPPTPSLTPPDTNKQKPSSASSSPQQTVTPSSTHGSDVLRYPLSGIPTVPTIKMDYINQGGAHFLYIYSYNLMVNNFEFVIHPVHSQNYTSDFYVPGYLNMEFSNPNAEPDQQVNGNPNLTNWSLNDGDVYTVSVCSYDSGACGVISSNSVTLTISVDYSHGASAYIYNYSQ